MGAERVDGTGRATVRRRPALVVLLVAVLVGLTACNPPNQVPSNGELGSGQVLYSPDRTFRLEMQAGGNLVLRRTGGPALWTSKTPGNNGAKLVMRPTGSLAVISSGGRVLWSTPTTGAHGATVDLGNDANLLVRGTAGQPLWASGSSTASAARRPLRERTTSTHQIALTKIYEGLVASKPYHNSSGHCTVGYGHLIRLGSCTAADRAKTWDADALFATDVKEHERRIKSTIGSVPVTQREFDALFDYAFNRGSITATSAPKTYAALTATPPRYSAVGPALREAGDASIRGLCDRRYDEAEVFEGGAYDRTYRCR